MIELLAIMTVGFCLTIAIGLAMIIIAWVMRKILIDGD